MHLRQHALASPVCEGRLLHGGVDAGELGGLAATLQLLVDPVRHVRHLRLWRPQHRFVARTCVGRLESSSFGVR